MSFVDGIYRYGSTALARWRLARLGAELGKGTVFFGQPILTLESGGRLRIGDGVTMTSNAKFTALGVRAPIVLRCLTPEAVIEIGDHCGLSGTAICAATQIKIGARCLIGADCMIADTDFHNLPVSERLLRPKWERISRPIEIGDDISLGARTIVLKGARIGSGSIIAAGSVVTGTIPPGTIAGGIPARHLASVQNSDG